MLEGEQHREENLHIDTLVSSSSLAFSETSSSAKHVRKDAAMGTMTFHCAVFRGRQREHAPSKGPAGPSRIVEQMVPGPI